MPAPAAVCEAALVGVPDDEATIITGRGPAVRAAGTTRRRGRVTAVIAATVVAALALAIGGVLLARSDPAAGVALTSAPEYWESRGKPVVHRTLAVEDGALIVRLRVTKVPVKGFEAVERIPVMVRDRPMTTAGHAVRLDATGALRLSVPYRRSNVSHASYRIALPPTVHPSRFLHRYEQARVRLVQRAPAPTPRALRALELAPALRIHAGQQAWLPVSGVTLRGQVDTEVAETLGGAWRWTSTDPRVAVVARAHPDPHGGRNPRSTYATVVARAPGHTTLATTVAGRSFTVEVTVVAGRATPSTCEPGVFPAARLQLTESRGSRHPVEGTLVAVTGGPPTVRAEGGKLVPVDGRPCAGASVVHLSAADYLRLVAGQLTSG